MDVQLDDPVRFPNRDKPIDKTPHAVKVGAWKGYKLDADKETWPLGNTVYILRDGLGYMHRQIAGLTVDGETVRPFCTHEDVDYLPQYQNLSQEDVDTAVLTLLEALEGPLGSGRSTARPSATGSAAASDTQR